MSISNLMQACQVYICTRAHKPLLEGAVGLGLPGQHPMAVLKGQRERGVALKPSGALATNGAPPAAPYRTGSWLAGSERVGSHSK